MNDYKRGEFLVETEWLANHLDDPKVRIFDCTTHLVPDPDKVFRVESGLADYQAGHIPGAGYLDLQADLSDPAGTYRFTTPGPEAFAAALGAKGLGDDYRVVLYSTAAVSWATRIWWMLYAYGFENAAILNGGWQKWQAEGRAVSTDDCTYSPATFMPSHQPGRIIDRDAVLAALGDDHAVVVNALTKAQHEGTSKAHYGRPGGITGSVCLPALDLVAGDNTFLTSSELEAKFAETGIGMDQRVLTYCGGGVAATVDSFALTLLGHDDVGIYDASLSEWANDDSLPMTAAGLVKG
ncbi:MAG: sulfurtransferase [Rhodospirillaceae bacterium]|nr:sulfurtransferase [Rhodospirillaceae bacterium]MBT4690088.1 sulfurtransferase [Rhodospirillaceae bacterium]MBT5082641.1 sulfurtransferase [Rhodospirillaceae bacterium]MBT5526029.1 sulfurtransferase [Rhodospirillaceae bacterium]MBT5878133.1 sulfurtransferase [Rhodospirillaceae bacterium]